MNLEATYGSKADDGTDVDADEGDTTNSLSRLFQRALTYADQKKLYLAMVGICERTKKIELCRQVLNTMCKKFGSSAKVWLRHLTHWMTTTTSTTSSFASAASAAAAALALKNKKKRKQGDEEEEEEEAMRQQQWKQGECKKVMDRAMQSLPKRKHLKVLRQAALLEFRLGSAER